jgi:hypothetical protein
MESVIIEGKIQKEGEGDPKDAPACCLLETDDMGLTVEHAKV